MTDIISYKILLNNQEGTAVHAPFEAIIGSAMKKLANGYSPLNVLAVITTKTYGIPYKSDIYDANGTNNPEVAHDEYLIKQ